MKTILGVLIIIGGCCLAAVMNFSLISDIIAIAALYFGGKLCASD